MKKEAFSVLGVQSSIIPQFSEEGNKPWVYFGDNNLYPYYLDDLVFSSAIHGAIVKGTADMIYAGGLDSPEKDKHVDQWLRLQALFPDDTLYKLAWDLKLYGNAYINVIWSVDRTSIAEVHHLPANSMRTGHSDDDEKIPTFYHSANWNRYSDSRYSPTPIPAFSTEDRAAASQVIHVKLYNPISYYYGLPDYIGATNYIELDKDISEFHLNNIKNGLFPSMMISFNNGVPTEEERIMTERMIYEKFSGSSNAGKILLSWNDDAADAPKFEPIDNNSPHETYSYLSNEVVVKVLSGHRVTSPLMFGLRSEGGGFGSNADEMQKSFELYQSTVISAFQDSLLEAFRPVFAVNNITIPIEFKEYIPAEFLKPVKTKPNQFKKEVPFKIDSNSERYWLSKLKNKHQPLDKSWKLFKSETVSDTSFEKKMNKKMNFASMGELESYDNVAEESEWGDIITVKGFHFKLRYAYSQNDSKGESKTGISRDFCEKMVDLSRSGVQYRYEDIQDMSDDGINDRFAEHGQSTYDIFEWKGGKNCYHAWLRNIYVQVEDGMPIEDLEFIEVLENEWDDVMQRVGNNNRLPQAGNESIPTIVLQ